MITVHTFASLSDLSTLRQALTAKGFSLASYVTACRAASELRMQPNRETPTWMRNGCVPWAAVRSFGAYWNETGPTMPKADQAAALRLLSLRSVSRLGRSPDAELYCKYALYEEVALPDKVLVLSRSHDKDRILLELVRRAAASSLLFRAHVFDLDYRTRADWEQTFPDLELHCRASELDATALSSAQMRLMATISDCGAFFAVADWAKGRTQVEVLPLDEIVPRHKQLVLCAESKREEMSKRFGWSDVREADSWLRSSSASPTSFVLIRDGLPERTVLRAIARPVSHLTVSQ